MHCSERKPLFGNVPVILGRVDGVIYICFLGEAKNLPMYPGPNKMRDCYCTVNLDQEEVFRTKIVEKSLW